MSDAGRAIIPRPLHNEDASLRALARQLLADLDVGADATLIANDTLRLLLGRLCDLLSDPTPAAIAAERGAVTEAATASKLLYFKPPSDEDE